MRASLKLKPNENLTLVDFGDTSLAYQKRLLALGLFPGVKIQIIRQAPLGCPIQIKVNNRFIALRKKEVEALHWERV